MGRRTVYAKEFSRDFPLLTVEVWYKAERSDPRQWTEKRQPKNPYIVFKRIKGLVEVYMDSAGIQWIEDEIRSILKQDSEFTYTVIEELEARFLKLEPAIKRGAPLSKQELVSFVAQWRDGWAWFEPMWWMIKMFEKSTNSKELNTLMDLREKTEEYAPGGNTLVRRSIDALYPDLGEHRDVVLIEEIAHDKLPEKEELERRLVGYYYTDDRLFVGEDDQFIENRFNIELEEPTVARLDRVQGENASPGIAQGRVHIVRTRHDMSTFKDNGIIVSPMTLPEFMPILKRCSAIVTDEGGITCHAAIISRELKKPCVIGTKVATQIFKDGDMVEVDANKGIVKKITRP